MGMDQTRVGGGEAEIDGPALWLCEACVRLSGSSSSARHRADLNPHPDMSSPSSSLVGLASTPESSQRSPAEVGRLLGLSQDGHAASRGLSSNEVAALLNVSHRPRFLWPRCVTPTSFVADLAAYFLRVQPVEFSFLDMSHCRAYEVRARASRIGALSLESHTTDRGRSIPFQEEFNSLYLLSAVRSALQPNQDSLDAPFASIVLWSALGTDQAVPARFVREHPHLILKFYEGLGRLLIDMARRLNGQKASLKDHVSPVGR